MPTVNETVNMEKPRKKFLILSMVSSAKIYPAALSMSKVIKTQKITIDERGFINLVREQRKRWLMKGKN